MNNDPQPRQREIVSLTRRQRLALSLKEAKKPNGEPRYSNTRIADILGIQRCSVVRLVKRARTAKKLLQRAVAEFLE